MTRTLPFSGTRVISFAQLAQGPASVQLLADLGADVIKIERPGTGSLERTYRLRNGESLLFQMLHRNQKSMTLDLKSPEGIEIVRRLIDQADVVVENFRPGVMERLGLGYEELARTNSRLVYLSASGYGPDGPYVSRPGQDLILQALSGIITATGRRSDPPTPVGAAIIDLHSAALNAFGLAAALLQREKTGRGQKITTNLMDAAAHLQTENIFDCANGIHKVRSETGLASPGASVPYGVYQTADGHMVLSDMSLKQIAETLDLPDLADRPREEGFTHRDEIRPRIAERMLERRTQEWLDFLLPLGVWCGEVKSYEQFLDDPQVVHNRLMFEMEHPRLGTLRNIRNPVTMSDAPLEDQPRNLAPELGQHTDAVLAELGFGPDDIARLRAAKVV